MKKNILSKLFILELVLFFIGCAGKNDNEITKEKLAIWNNVPSNKLDTHSLLVASIKSQPVLVPVHKLKTDPLYLTNVDKVEIRKYYIYPCNHIFYIKDAKVIEYTIVNSSTLKECTSKDILYPEKNSWDKN
jgi:hypothetical protein